MLEILLMLQVFLAEDPEIEYLFCGAPSGSETSLLFCNDLLGNKSLLARTCFLNWTS